MPSSDSIVALLISFTGFNDCRTEVSTALSEFRVMTGVKKQNKLIRKSDEQFISLCCFTFHAHCKSADESCHRY